MLAKVRRSFAADSPPRWRLLIATEVVAEIRGSKTFEYHG